MSITREETVQVLVQLATEECLVIPSLALTKNEEQERFHTLPHHTTAKESLKKFAESSLRRGAIKRKGKHQTLEQFIKKLTSDQREKRLVLITSLFFEGPLRSASDYLTKQILKAELDCDCEMRDTILTKLRIIFPELICIKETTL